MILFVYHFLYLPMTSPKILDVSLLVSVLLPISQPLLVEPFIFTEKSDYDKVNLVLSVISVIKN